MRWHRLMYLFSGVTQAHAAAWMADGNAAIGALMLIAGVLLYRAATAIEGARVAQKGGAA